VASHRRIFSTGNIPQIPRIDLVFWLQLPSRPLRQPIFLLVWRPVQFGPVPFKHPVTCPARSALWLLLSGFPRRISCLHLCLCVECCLIFPPVKSAARHASDFNPASALVFWFSYCESRSKSAYCTQFSINWVQPSGSSTRLASGSSSPTCFQLLLPSFVLSLV
jgi:hypothetical protein